MVVAIIILLILVIAVFGVLYWSYHKTFYSPTKDMDETDGPAVIMKHPYSAQARANIRKLADTPCQFVHTRSFDGLRLSGRYYEGREDMPLCICFHGYRGSALRDFSACGLFLMREGYNVLLIDERAHWRSQGHTISFGINERFDVMSWLKFAERRFGADKPVNLFGISMGGGTVLMASGQELPESVKCIVADCPFNSPKDIIKHVCRKVKLNPELSWPLVWAAAHVYGHFDINATTAAEEVKKTTVPILIIHGEGDDFVPMSMSEEVYDANPEMITRYTIPEAGHGLSYYYDTERYEKLVLDFLHEHNREEAGETDDEKDDSAE